MILRNLSFLQTVSMRLSAAKARPTALVRVMYITMLQNLLVLLRMFQELIFLNIMDKRKGINYGTYY
jgi:hypothetical protein